MISRIKVVRTNAAATGFGQVRVISPPPRLFDFIGLGAEGSTGSLDLLALEVQANHTAAWLDAQIDPELK